MVENRLGMAAEVSEHLLPKEGLLMQLQFGAQRINFYLTVEASHSALNLHIAVASSSELRHAIL